MDKFMKETFFKAKNMVLALINGLMDQRMRDGTLMIKRMVMESLEVLITKYFKASGVMEKGKGGES